MKFDFDKLVADQQVAWRQSNVRSPEFGKQNGYERPWILPVANWEEGLWSGIRSGMKNSLPNYLRENGIQKHTGSHNLKSSWTLCANLYFPFVCDLPLLASFLNDAVSDEIRFVTRLHLEYEHPTLKPSVLLGEPETGVRGSGQTSPDLAIEFETRGRESGLLLVENKYTEHSFYACSGRAKKNGNEHPEMCLDFSKVCGDSKSLCWQRNWEAEGRLNRTYWPNLTFSEYAHQTLKRCPAATAGYQLFRQQALAEALAEKSEYSSVYSCVAFHEDNETLIGSLKGTGLQSFNVWGDLFLGKVKFAIWTHQQWIKWVEDHDHAGNWSNWLDYVRSRYQLP